jgi:hypothetical protein
MDMPRKTKAERNAEYERERRRHWEDFREKLRAAKSFLDAKILVAQAPREGSPGRAFYSNLGFFLGEFTMPGSASAEERQLYKELLRRMDADGNLKPGVLEAFERNNP